MRELQRSGDDIRQAPAVRVAGGLSAAATTALRCAIQAHLQGRVCEDGMRAALRALCEEGRRRGLRVEHLLVALKGAWASLPEASTPPHDAGRCALDRLVSACIQEYYGPASGRAAAGPARAG